MIPITQDISEHEHSDTNSDGKGPRKANKALGKQLTFGRLPTAAKGTQKGRTLAGLVNAHKPPAVAHIASDMKTASDDGELCASNKTLSHGHLLYDLVCPLKV